MTGICLIVLTLFLLRRPLQKDRAGVPDPT